MCMIYDLKKAETELRKMRKTVKSELRNFPEGKLMISNGKEGVGYYQVTYRNGERIRKGIGSHKLQIYRLAHKAYLEEFLSRLDYNIRQFEQIPSVAKEINEDAILKNLPKNFSMLNTQWILNPSAMRESLVPMPSSDVEPVYLKPSFQETFTDTAGENVKSRNGCEQESEQESELQYKTNLESQKHLSADSQIDLNARMEEWFTMPYAENTSFPEYKTITAYNGLKTRSKSEALILERYGSKNIFYHYDEMVWMKDKKVSPDIIALRKDGTFFIHEHAGLWSEEYMRKNQWKFALYESAGFVQGKNMLISFDDENGNINLKLIDVLIDDMVER